MNRKKDLKIGTSTESFRLSGRRSDLQRHLAEERADVLADAGLHFNIEA